MTTCDGSRGERGVDLGGPGAAIQFTVSGGPGNPVDWVTLHAGLGARQRLPGLEVPERDQDRPGHRLTSASLQIHRAVDAGHLQHPLLCQQLPRNKLATSATIAVGVQPTLTIGDVSVTEGNSGTSVATFTVTLSPVNSSQTVTVDYATANGTATTRQRLRRRQRHADVRTVDRDADDQCDRQRRYRGRAERNVRRQSVGRDQCRDRRCAGRGHDHE